MHILKFDNINTQMKEFLEKNSEKYDIQVTEIEPTIFSLQLKKKI
ncbi:hypothetical protein [Rickettsia oklahomensis]|uniref:Uncharacterized protein n=1 Tax=Rickettsia oklahomensis TaxID=3141789 RepID=A0AAU7BYJ0_9RICK